MSQPQKHMETAKAAFNHEAKTQSQEPAVPAEKQAREALAIFIKEKNNFDADMTQTPTIRQYKARDKIISLGQEALPVLAGAVNDEPFHSENRFSYWDYFNLAQHILTPESDSKYSIDILLNEKVWNKQDQSASAYNTGVKLIARLGYEADSPELKQRYLTCLTHVITKIYEKSENAVEQRASQMRKAITAIGIIGGDYAENFLEDLLFNAENRQLAFFIGCIAVNQGLRLARREANLRYPEYRAYIQKPKLPTIEELQKLWERYSGMQEIIENAPSLDQEITENTSSLDEELIARRITQVINFTRGKKLPSTTIPAINLSLFNFLTENPNAGGKELEKEFLKLKRWIEKEAGDLNPESPRPTIGVEIEIPDYLWIEPDPDIASNLGIEGNPDRTAVWEYSLPPSASPWLQSFMIHELIRGNFIPSEQTAKGRQMIPNAVIRVHLNFALPEDVYYFKNWVEKGGYADKNIVKVNSEAVIFANALSTAFASPQRIRGKNYSFPINFGKKGGKKIVKKESDALPENSPPENDLSVNRFEIRSLDIKSHKIYRLLVESQRLTACFYDSIREDAGENLSPEGGERAFLWKKFLGEVERTFKIYIPEVQKTLDLSNWKQVQKTAEIMETTPIVSNLRSIITRYSLAAAPLTL